MGEDPVSVSPRVSSSCGACLRDELVGYGGALDGARGDLKNHKLEAYATYF